VFDARRGADTFLEMITCISLGPDYRTLWPQEAAMSPDGHRLYVSMLNAQQVAVLDTNPLSGTYHQILKRIPAGLLQTGITLLHDGRWLCVIDNLAESLLVYDLRTAEDPEAIPSLHTQVRLGHGPLVAVPSHSEDMLYVVTKSDRISVVETSDPDPGLWSLAYELPMPWANAGFLALTPDQSRGYLNFSNNAVVGVRLDEPHPVLQNLAPLTADEGALVTLTGRGFSPVLEENAVRLGGVATLPESASSDRLAVRIPRGAVSGPVTVTVDGRESNARTLTVTPLEATRIPAMRYLFRLDLSPDGRYAVCGQMPLPAENAQTVLIDTDPASGRFHEILWQGTRGVTVRGVQFAPDGSKAYLQVDNEGLLALDINTPGETDPAFRPLDDRGMTAMAFSPDQAYGYVASRRQNELYEIRVDTDLPTGRNLQTGTDSSARIEDVIANPSDRRWVYVLSRINTETDRVLAVDIEPWEVVASSPASEDGAALACSPDGRHIFVTDRTTGQVVVLDANLLVSSATEIDARVAWIPVGVNPETLVHAPDRQRLYVVNQGSAGFSVIDTDPESSTFLENIQDVSTIPGPTDIALSPDGSRAYVVSRYGQEAAVQVFLLHEMP